MRRTLSRFYLGIVFIYIAALLILFLLGRVASTEELRGVSNALFALLLFGSLVLFPLSILLRRPRLIVLTAIPFAAWLVVAIPAFLPRNPQMLPDAASITVMTFNVQTPAEEGVESLVTVIRAADADIVGIQELSGEAATGFASLEDIYPYQALYPDSEYDGQGLLSRYPIASEEYWHSPEYPYGQLRAEVDVDGATVIIYVLHPTVPMWYENGVEIRTEHSRVLDEFFGRAADESQPIIVMGDLNMTPQFEMYQRAAGQFTDSFRAAGDRGFGFSFPAGMPVLRLDYIWHNTGFASQEGRVWADSGSSDHRPYRVRLAFTEGQ